jgi:hypothetical protein
MSWTVMKNIEVENCLRVLKTAFNFVYKMLLFLIGNVMDKKKRDVSKRLFHQ